MRRISRAVAAVLATAVVLAAAGCAQQAPNADPLERSADEIRLYGSDGNMLNAVGDLLVDYPDALTGMKGTTPLSRLSQSFRDRLRGIDSQLKDEAYAGEAYDAVVISALAAQIALTTDPKAIAGQINGVTTAGTACETPSDCLALIEAGEDILYKGISLGLGGFTDQGEPSASTFGILRFAANNHLDSEQTQYVPAGEPTTATTKGPPARGTPSTGGQLIIGALLPHTGDLAGAGPPMFAGALLAIKEVNDAGGVLGQPVKWIDGDDFTDGTKAKGTVERLISEGVDVIIGAGASSITMAVLPTVLAAGVVLFSPCNTAAELTNVDDKGLYFRTAPPDGLQAAALTDIIMRDGVRRIAIVARDDEYGKGLMDSVRDDLIGAGLSAADIKTVPYNTDKPEFESLGATMRSFAPEGVLIIGYDETAKALESILKAGFTSRAI